MLSSCGSDQSIKQTNTQTASILGLGAVNAETAPLVLNSFRSRSLANETHDHRDRG